MICLICRQAEPIDGLASVIFERGEIKLLINKVPARVCPACGEAYLNAACTVQLLQEAEAISRAGKLEEVIEYNGCYLSESATTGFQE